MAERVVDGLEAIKIEKQHTQYEIVLGRIGERGLQLVEKLSPIGQTGQRVVPGEMLGFIQAMLLPSSGCGHDQRGQRRSYGAHTARCQQQHDVVGRQLVEVVEARHPDHRQYKTGEEPGSRAG